MSQRPWLIIALCLAVHWVSAAPVDIRPQDNWYARHQEGWFWYRSQPEPVEPEPTNPEVSTAAGAIPPVLSTAWFREHMSAYEDKAIDDPTPESLSALLYLNRVMKEKSERFAEVGQRVIHNDPLLDENVRRPLDPSSARVNDIHAYQAREAVLRQVAQRAGLLLYYQGRCTLCQHQAHAVQLLNRLYGFPLIPVTTDHVTLPEFPDSRHQAPPPVLGIQAYPSLFLMEPPDTYLLLRQGASNFTDLADRIVTVAWERGWISEEDYQGTRIARSVWDGKPLKLDIHGVPSSDTLVREIRRQVLGLENDDKTKARLPSGQRWP